MSIPVTTLIGSPRRLVTTIVLFVALDLSVLVINLWLGEQLARDAVAINLAGRQRMLSQQTTKALLLSIGATNPDDAALALQEFNTAFGLFTQTLTAFSNGGKARGGDGAEGSLQPVKGEAIHLVSAARDIVAPVERLLAAPESVCPMPGPQFVQAADYMVRNNQELLVLMNSLTTAHNRLGPTPIPRLHRAVRRPQPHNPHIIAGRQLAHFTVLSGVHARTVRTS